MNSSLTSRPEIDDGRLGWRNIVCGSSPQLLWNSHHSPSPKHLWHPRVSLCSAHLSRAWRHWQGSSQPHRRPQTRSFLWRAGTKLGLLPVQGDESQSPQKGSCQGNPEPLRCLTFICFFFVYPQRGLPTRGRWGCCLYGNPSRHVWRQGCQLDLDFALCGGTWRSTQRRKHPHMCKQQRRRRRPCSHPVGADASLPCVRVC